MFQEESKIPKAMVKYASGISLESIVDILAEVTVAESPVQSATIKSLELSIKEGNLYENFYWMKQFRKYKQSVVCEKN